MKKVVKIAVRSLIEQMYRSGSLGIDFTSAERASEGIAGHRKIQKSRPEGYQTEVPIVHQHDTPYFILEISGRIDGVFGSTQPVTLEELKTTILNFDNPDAVENPVHWGQLKLYAYCYAREHGLEQIAGQLTYYQIDTGGIREYHRLFTLNELTAYFQEVISRFLVWANAVEEWHQLRDASLRNIAFPFPEYRTGQRQIAVDVYLTVKQRGQLLVQAPTGIGKTMAVIFSAVKALGEGHVEKIFYLTARNTGKIAVEEAFTRLRQNGLRLKAVTITAKEKSCLAPEIYCQPEACEFAQGYYDRIDQALKAAFELDELTSEVITELARRFKVCPFEFSLDLSLLADCIIGDYNYAFDPRVYLKRFFRDNTGIYTFLIDEAHNLVDRSREMFSAELSKQDIQNLRKAIKPHLPKLYRLSGKINRWLNQAKKQCRERGESYADTASPETLLPLLIKFNNEAEKWLVLNMPSLYRKDLTDRYFEINRFLTVAEKFDECYATCFDHSSGDLRVKLFCLDPSRQMQETLERSQSAVFFSATLTPMDYFQRLFGCRESTRQRTYASPFPPENLCLLMMPKISTLYNKREATVPAVTQGIIETIRQKQGNYLLFFPSYKYLQMVYDGLTAQQPDLDTIVQASTMTEEERDDFLARFSCDNRRTLAGFAVMGGIFGEGIDLVGDRLTGAVIVGVGLPAICLERDLIRAYFDKSDGVGFEFAYMYPGLNRVLQAAGRVIRTETDRGVVVLIDERFSSSRYRTLFPKDWRPVTITTAGNIHETLREFWGT